MAGPSGLKDAIRTMIELVLTWVFAMLCVPLAPIFYLVVGVLQRKKWASPPKEYKSVLITGASAGIGRALAEDFAGPGVHLALSARTEARLADVREACLAKGATVEVMALDVTEQEAMEEWVQAVDAAHPLDLVVANAGVSAGTLKSDDLSYLSRAVFDINVYGVFNTVLPAIPGMKERGSGQILLMSSVASCIPLPDAPAYGASKSAIRSWGTAMRAKLMRYNVCVNIAAFGFVKSEMTDANIGKFKMPYIMPQKEAVAHIRSGLTRNTGMIMFPMQLTIPLELLRKMPTSLADLGMGLIYGSAKKRTKKKDD